TGKPTGSLTRPDVFPAPAGINRSGNRDTCQHSRVPRASGDKPSLLPVVSLIDSCSPRQRG
ncbi:TPA: hypothetical protein ACHJI7_002689, partial [Escherichia coli]